MESKTILLIFVFKTFSFFYLKNQLSSNCFNLPYETTWTRDTWISQDTVVITNILFIFLDLTLLSVFLFSFFFLRLDWIGISRKAYIVQLWERKELWLDRESFRFSSGRNQNLPFPRNVYCQQKQMFQH